MKSPKAMFLLLWNLINLKNYWLEQNCYFA